MLPQPYAERLMATQVGNEARPILVENAARTKAIDKIVSECRAQYPHLFRTADDLAVQAKEWARVRLAK